MDFEHNFTVEAPIEAVWDTLLDVERVVPCMPGAEVVERAEDDVYTLIVKAKLGPISLVYPGQVAIVERRDAARVATFIAHVEDPLGQGPADAQIELRLDEQPDGARATLTTELRLSGRTTAVSRDKLNDLAAKLIETFAANLAELLLAADVAAVGRPS